MRNFVDDGVDTCLKVQNHKSVQMEGSNRAFCNRCNCFFALESSGDDFFISNKKQHQCQLDKCAICQEHLGYLSERDKIRFRRLLRCYLHYKTVTEPCKD